MTKSGPSATRLLVSALRHGPSAPEHLKLHAAYWVARAGRLLDLASRQVIAIGPDDGRADAFCNVGATCLVVGTDCDRSAAGIVGDRYWLPLRDGVADLSYCAASQSACEFVGVLDELARITRAGGLVCLSLTGPRGQLLRHLRQRSDLVRVSGLLTTRLPSLTGEIILRRAA
jgi:hypothetical protein